MVNKIIKDYLHKVEKNYNWKTTINQDKVNQMPRI